MQYLIYGTGAVGGLMGARLAHSGHRVTFLARENVAAVLRQTGITIQSNGQRTRVAPTHVVTELHAAFQTQPPDLIILTVKAFDCQTAAEDIRDQASKPTPVLSMLNGIGNEEILGTILGADRVLAGTLTTAVQHVEPGLVRIERARGVGLAQDHPLADPLGRDLRSAGFHVRLYPDRNRMKWSKLLTNIVANATSAIVGWTPDQIFAHAGLALLEIEALRETVRLMRRMGISPQDLPRVPVSLLGRAIFLPAAIIRPLLRRVVATGRGDKLPSFHHDIGKGRCEVDWLNGAVRRQGIQLGLPTPANTVLTETMLELVHNRDRLGSFRHRPEALLARARQAGVPGMTDVA